jgi:hypothetical protein
MSRTRPQNDEDNAAKTPKEDSSLENDERQKKHKADQSTNETPSLYSGIDPVASPPKTFSSSSFSSSATTKSTSLGFVPRQLKRKPDPIPASSSTPIPVRLAATSSSKLITSMLASVSATSSSSASFEAKPVKTENYIKLEVQLSRLGDLAHLIAPIAAKQNKVEADFHAISYSLILITERLDYIKKFHTTIYNENINQLLIDYKFKTSMHTLETTIDALPHIRNVLSDHYIRIPIKINLHDLFNLQDDMAKLATLNKHHENGDDPFFNKSTTWLNKMDKLFIHANVEDKTVSYSNRVTTILTSLDTIHSIKSADPELSSLQATYEAAMLYVIVGTCARELSRSTDVRLTAFFATDAGAMIKNQLENLVGIRNTAAHYVDSSSSVLKALIQNTHEETLRSNLNVHIPTLTAALAPSIEEKSEKSSMPQRGK